ncbi:hypothetical protein RI367_008271 [Sorochytrium milnesiophthora]
MGNKQSTELGTKAVLGYCKSYNLSTTEVFYAHGVYTTAVNKLHDPDSYAMLVASVLFADVTVEKMTFAVFLQRMVAWPQMPFQMRAQYLFQVLDLDKDGKIGLLDVCGALRRTQSQIGVGDVVRMMADGQLAQVKFVGTMAKRVGQWIGVELPSASGKCDGMDRGQRYFTCDAKHGRFVDAKDDSHFQAALGVLRLLRLRHEYSLPQGDKPDTTRMSQLTDDRSNVTLGQFLGALGKEELAPVTQVLEAVSGLQMFPFTSLPEPPPMPAQTEQDEEEESTEPPLRGQKQHRGLAVSSQPTRPRP